MTRMWRWALPALALTTLAAGATLGLVIAPPERMMGDVYRIMFVHVPSAWIALIAYTVTLGASIAYLIRGNERADALAASSAEVGVVLNALTLITGSIWGRPTWGVYWTWDPRLTTAAVMLFSYASYLALRALVDDAERRANWSAVIGIIVYVNIIFVWFSVQWWATLHQMQSTPETIPDPTMKLALRTNAFAFLFIYLWFVRVRYALARAQQSADAAGPDAPAEALS